MGNLEHLSLLKLKRELLQSVEVTDALSTELRAALLNKLDELSRINLLATEPSQWVTAIAAAAKLKAVVAETYTDVHVELASISATRGRAPTASEVAQVCRTLHPECFEVVIF